MRHIFFASLAVFAACIPGCLEQFHHTKLRPGVTFEVHRVSLTSASDTTEHEDPDTGAPLHLVDPPIITADNITEATVTTDANGIATLEVKVNHAGANRLAAATAVPGGQLAIVVNGKIASAPMLHSRIDAAFKLGGSSKGTDWNKIVE
jgi:preprotein translocase subunit SecD